MRQVGACKERTIAYYPPAFCGIRNYHEIRKCGRSSGVERNLAKVEVVGSNPIARSNFLKIIPCSPTRKITLATGDVSSQWYNEEMQWFCNLVLVSSYFIDNKIAKVTQGRTAFFKILRVLNFLYRPIAIFRLRHGLSRALFEYNAYQMLSQLLASVQSRLAKDTT